MGMIEVKQTFSRNELLWFGPLFALFTGLICWVLWRCGVPAMPLTLLAVAALVVIFVYYLFPALQRPFYRGWMFSVMPIGWAAASRCMRNERRESCRRLVSWYSSTSTCRNRRR